MEPMMFADWGPVASFMLLCVVVAASMLVVNALLQVKVKKRLPSTLDTYECGEEPDGSAWIRFHPRYYVVALLFVVFDVEAAFLFPWALNIEALGLFAIVEMSVFLGILFIGWLYAVKKGAIKWQ
jgi:NADH:ubiquinone oxidoreductase subunit 3 (subunit A)